jgi:hypothetical protein
MSQPLNLGNTCGSTVRGIRRIALPDGDQVGLVGLDDALESVFRERKLPDDSTAMELIDRLRPKNYIPNSPAVERLYKTALLNEYQRYCKNRKR